MIEGLRLVIYREKILYKHWTRREVISLITASAIAIALFVITGERIQMAGSRMILPAVLTLAGVTLAGILYTAVTAVNAWFTSPDAFLLITKPCSIKQMYWYHWSDTGQKFLKNFGHLLLPVLIVFGIKLGGLPGVLMMLVLFLGLLSLAVCTGFFMVFYFLNNKEQPVWIILFAVTVAAASIMVLYLWRINLVGCVIAVGIFWSAMHWKAPAYMEKVFGSCLDAANISPSMRINQYMARFFKEVFLFNQVLTPVFRAILYKELITEERNWYKYARYLAVILFLLLYLPLSKTSLFEQGGIIAVLIYGHLVMVLNVHDGFAAIFAKEGNKIIYLLPRFISWQVGLAKYTAAMLEMFPLIVMAAGFFWIKLSLNMFQGLSFGAALFLLSAAHIAAVIVIGIRFLNLEERDTALLPGMIWEQTLGMINPGILFGYTASFMIPTIFGGALLGLYFIHPGVLLWSYIWLLNFMAVIFISIGLVFGKVLYERRLKEILGH